MELDRAVTFAPSGDVVVAARSSLRKGSNWSAGVGAGWAWNRSGSCDEIGKTKCPVICRSQIFQQAHFLVVNKLRVTCAPPLTPHRPTSALSAPGIACGASR